MMFLSHSIQFAGGARLLASVLPGEGDGVPGIPAARWAADAGSRGISLVLVAHGIAQLEERFGKSGARTIMGCCAAKLAFGGTSDADSLANPSGSRRPATRCCW
jgi:hypothetical protein